MSETHIRVIYDGPAVDDGLMEIGQLAASLLALGKVIEASDAALTGHRDRIRVHVKSDLRRGSFDVGVVVSAVQTAIAWFQQPEVAGTATLLSLLGINAKDGAKGVIQVVRWLRGRRIKAKTTLQDGSTVLELEDGDKLDVSQAVARLVDDPAVRQPLERFTEPLRDEGVEEIRFEDAAGASETITSREADAFKANAGTDPTSVSEFEATYQIKRLYFERGRKWRLSNGAQTILAAIEDDAFWERIERSEERFASEDYLVCDVRMDQWLSDAGLKTEYSISRVKNHIAAPRQQSFLGEFPPEGPTWGLMVSSLRRRCS